MVSKTLDLDGRRVVLTEERWRHITMRRPRMAGELREIMRTVREPDRQMRGRSERETWFFTHRGGAFPWLQVAVHSEGGEDG